VNFAIIVSDSVNVDPCYDFRLRRSSSFSHRKPIATNGIR
jgi:hypothetical protein